MQTLHILWTYIRQCSNTILVRIAIVFLTTTLTAASDVTPTLQNDTSNIQWVGRVTEGNAPLGYAAELSEQSPYFVIFVVTTPKHKDAATKHAQKLAAWFENHPEAPDKIQVIAHENNKGVGYVYFINGLQYWHEAYAPNLFMTPQQSHQALEDAVLTYRARMAIKSERESSAKSN